MRDLTQSEAIRIIIDRTHREHYMGDVLSDTLMCQALEEGKAIARISDDGTLEFNMSPVTLAWMHSEYERIKRGAT